MARVLLTGATGFLGGHLLVALLNNGNSVTALKRRNSTVNRISELNSRCIIENIEDNDLDDLFRKGRYDAVIHTACNYGRNGETVAEVIQTNVIFGVKLLEASIRNKINLFINADSLLPRKTNAYALAKNQFSEWLELNSDKIQVINFKIEHMYGPYDSGDKFLGWLIKQFRVEVDRIPLTEGNQQRDFVYIDDVLQAFMLVLKNARVGVGFTNIELGSGEQICVKHFVETLRALYLEYQPNLKTVLGFSDIPSRLSEIDMEPVCLETLKALGWQRRYSLEEGLRETLRKELLS